jgi:transcriptional regulator with XRE-family HTH domain
MDSKKTGEFIAQLRKEKRITQSELADLIGVTNKAVSRWETGEGFPEISFLPQLAKILGVTTDEILNGERSTKIEDTKSEKGLKVKLNSTTFISIMIMLVFAISSVGVAYLTYYEWIGMIILIVGILIGSILYIYNRYQYLYEDKSLIFNNTVSIYSTVIILIISYLPLLLLDPNSRGVTNNAKAIISFSTYSINLLTVLPVAVLVSLIAICIHEYIVFKKTTKLKYLSIFLILAISPFGFYGVIGLLINFELATLIDMIFAIVVFVLTLIFIKKYKILRLGICIFASAFLASSILYCFFSYKLGETTNIIRTFIYLSAIITFLITSPILYKSMFKELVFYNYIINGFILIYIITSQLKFKRYLDLYYEVSYDLNYMIIFILGGIYTLILMILYYFLFKRKKM